MELDEPRRKSTSAQTVCTHDKDKGLSRHECLSWFCQTRTENVIGILAPGIIVTLTHSPQLVRSRKISGATMAIITMQTIQVALVEDDAATRLRLCDAISAAPDLRLMASFENGRTALAWLEGHRPDVLLTDLGLPDIPGLAVLTYCAQRHPVCDIMVITLYDDPSHVVRCLEAGASGYLLKDSLLTEIAARIRELRAGGSPMTPAIARLVLKRFRSVAATAESSPLVQEVPALTAKELVVLSRIAQGFRYAEIAELQGVSTHTVHSHVKSIYSKLSVHSRSEAVHEAMQMGLIDKGLPHL